MIIFLIVLYIACVIFVGWGFLFEDYKKTPEIPVGDFFKAMFVTLTPGVNIIVACALVYVITKDAKFKNPFYKGK